MSSYRPRYYCSKPPPDMGDDPLEGLEGAIRVFGVPVGLGKAEASRKRQQERWRAEQAAQHRAEQQALNDWRHDGQHSA